MNQVAEDGVQKQCSQNNFYPKKRNKKAKDPTESFDDNNSIVNQEIICESLKNTLHINKLTNGTNDHIEADDENPNKCVENSEAQNVTVNKNINDVNSVQCSECCNNECSNEPPEGSERTMFDEALNKPESNISPPELPKDDIDIISYESELQMPEIMRLIQKDLSEPYSIYTYRYFIHNWPKLCFLATHEGKCIGAIVCKLDMHRNVVKRGYIAMLAVDEKYRKRKIGSKLVEKAIQAMIDDNADEVVLETEITNKPALKLYENLGFVRDKRLFRYYLNGVDALRLKLWLR